MWCKQRRRLQNDVVLCGVYDRLAVINKQARFFHDLELEELRQFQMRENATLIDSIRNITSHPVYGLETQLRNAKWKLIRTPLRGRMCVRTVFRTVGNLEPVLRNREDRPPKYRNGPKRHRRQLRRVRKMVRRIRDLREFIRWQLIVRAVRVSSAP